MATRVINIPAEEELDDLCYDLERARRQGLYEEITLTVNGREIPVTTDQFEQIMKATELGINVGPGDEQVLDAVITYEYVYGVPPHGDPV